MYVPRDYGKNYLGACHLYLRGCSGGEEKCDRLRGVEDEISEGKTPRLKYDALYTFHIFASLCPRMQMCMPKQKQRQVISSKQ